MHRRASAPCFFLPRLFILFPRVSFFPFFFFHVYQGLNLPGNEITNGILELHNFLVARKIRSGFIYIYFFSSLFGWVNWRDLYNLNVILKIVREEVMDSFERKNS